MEERLDFHPLEGKYYIYVKYVQCLVVFFFFFFLFKKKKKFSENYKIT